MISVSPKLDEVLFRLTITEVYQGLAGTTPHRTGTNTARAQATWRGRHSFDVSLDDSRSVWYDFAATEGGGVLNLIVQMRSRERVDALRWAAEFAGIPLDDRPISPAERSRWAQQKRLFAAQPLAIQGASRG